MWKFQYRWHIDLLFWRWNFVNFRHTSRSTRIGPYSRNSRTGRTTINTPGPGYLLKTRRRHRR